MKTAGKVISYYFMAILTILPLAGCILDLMWGTGTLSFFSFICFLLFQFFFVRILLKSLLPSGSPETKQAVKEFKRKNLFSFFLFFNLMLVASCMYMISHSFRAQQNMTLPEQLALIITFLVWLCGVCYLWVIMIYMKVLGTTRYWGQLFRFLREHVSVYLVFRLIVFAFTLIAGLIMLFLAENTSDATGLALLETYFTFVLDASLWDNVTTGFLSGSSTFVSGLTAAASYFVLSEMALEFLSETKQLSFQQRMLKLLTQSDSRKMILLTILCVVLNFIPSPSWELLPGMPAVTATAATLRIVLNLLWFLSLIAFLRETKLVPYLINYMVMCFIEQLIVLPESFFLAIPVFLLRIALFSAAALMIAFATKQTHDRLRALQNGTLQPGKDTLDLLVFQMTPALAMALGYMTYTAAQDAADSLKDAAAEKVKQTLRIRR